MWVDPSGTIELLLWRRDSIADRSNSAIVLGGDGSDEGLVHESGSFFGLLDGFVVVSHTALDVAGYLKEVARLIWVGFNKDCVVVPRSTGVGYDIDVVRHVDSWGLVSTEE